MPAAVSRPASGGPAWPAPTMIASNVFMGITSVDELLPAVDIVRRAGERGVDHEVPPEGGDVGGTDDAPDGEGRAKLLAAAFEPVGEVTSPSRPPVSRSWSSCRCRARP